MSLTAFEPSKFIVRELADHISGNVAGLGSVIENFPQPSEELVPPCVSIFIGKPTINNGMPYLVGKTAMDPDTKKSLVTTCQGTYDLRLQLDLWCGTKEERHVFWDLLFKALNPAFNPMGLSLALTGYNNEIYRYDIVGYQFMDAEQNAQRNEWRVQIDVLAHGRILFEREEYVMETIETTLEVSDTITVPV